MHRTIPAALALACVCSPAMAGAIPVAEMLPAAGSPAHGLAFGLLLFGALTLAIVVTLARRAMLPVLGVLVLIGAILACAAVPALAAEVATVGNTATILPWGQWVVAAMETIREPLINIVIVVVTAIVGRLGWFAQMWFTQQRIDRMVRLAADYAINAVSGAVKDRAASVDLAPLLLRAGLQRAMGSTEAWVTKAAGGEKGVTERLFRAFHFDETVTDANTLTPFLANLPDSVK